MSLRRQKAEREELGNMDPYWAILADPNRKFGKWNIGEFFTVGDQEIRKVMESTMHLGYPLGRELALDFGCGVGRLTRALAMHFRQCYGVDISESMVAKARELNGSFPNSTFFVNAEENLHLFPDNCFDMIYTNLVLQHLPRKSTIRSYISEFVRTLKQNGLLIFQLLSYIPVRNRLQPRRRLYALLRTLGINERFLYERLGLHPLGINFICPDDVLALLNKTGAKVLRVEVDPNFVSSIRSRIYCVTK